MKQLTLYVRCICKPKCFKETKVMTIELTALLTAQGKQRESKLMETEERK